jgi:hypothetical protein
VLPLAAVVSTGMLVTLEMLPLAVTCFEWQRWQQHVGTPG